MHSERASHQYYDVHVHKRIVQLCMHMSINDIPDRDRHIHTYVHMRIDPSHSEPCTNALGN